MSNVKTLKVFKSQGGAYLIFLKRYLKANNADFKTVLLKLWNFHKSLEMSFLTHESQRDYKFKAFTRKSFQPMEKKEKTISCFQYKIMNQDF